MHRKGKHVRRPCGFTLVELLVVMGIIGMLIALLLPALGRARSSAMQIQCLSNERQVGIALLGYSNAWNGALYPPGMGAATTPDHNTWPSVVFGVYDPPILFCPNDQDPAFAHSYVLNGHLRDHSIKYWANLNALHGLTPDKVILMGEKVSSEDDYYMDAGDFDRVVEKYRHGPTVGSNYLMLDMHAEPILPGAAFGELDPWDLVDTSAPPPVGGG